MQMKNAIAAVAVVVAALSPSIGFAETKNGLTIEMRNNTAAELLIIAETSSCWEFGDGDQITYIEGGHTDDILTTPSDSIFCALSSKWVTFRAVDKKHNLIFGEILVEYDDGKFTCKSERRRHNSESERQYHQHLQQECTTRKRHSTWSINTR